MRSLKLWGSSGARSALLMAMVHIDKRRKFGSLFFALHKGSDDFTTVRKFRNWSKVGVEIRVQNFFSRI